MIILLNGSTNAGKTTTAKALTQQLPNTAHVEIDSLREFVDCLTLQDSIPLNLENAALVTQNLARHGMNVVVSYPFSKKNYELFLQLLGKTDVSIHFVTLRPPLEHAITDRGNRPLTPHEVERVKHHYQIDLNNPDHGLILDNSQLTPEQTAQAILEYVNR